MRDPWPSCGSFFRAHGQNVPCWKKLIQVQRIHPALESRKILHQDGQCPIDGFRLIDQHGGVRRPVKAVAEILLQLEQLCVVVGSDEQNRSPGKNADVIARDVFRSRHHSPPLHTVL